MSSADVLVFDMANAPTQTSNVFVKKDYFSVQDDQGSAGYSGNQSVLQLSSLANSNRRRTLYGFQKFLHDYAPHYDFDRRRRRC